MKLKGTYDRVTAAYSLKSNSRTERKVPAIKCAIIRVLIDREAVWSEPLPVVMNAVREKRNKEGYSLYGMMFAAFLDWLLYPTWSSVEPSSFTSRIITSRSGSLFKKDAATDDTAAMRTTFQLESTNANQSIHHRWLGCCEKFPSCRKSSLDPALDGLSKSC